jgi:peptide/nickel transport system substrate-binding protein
MMAATASLEARDEKTFDLVLSKPFGLVLEALGTTSGPGPFIMPARPAATPATQQVPEIVGSGPFM